MSDQASILKPNATALERAMEAAIVSGKPDLTPVAQLMTPATCPEHLLGWLAWALSVDVWDSAWPEQTKRDVIANSVDVHRQKGTVASVKSALAAAGYGDAEIVEHYGTHTYDGQATYDGRITHVESDHWAQYRLRLTRPITIEQAAQVRKILATVIPARCHLRAIDYTQALHAHNAAIGHDGVYSHGVAA